MCIAGKKAGSPADPKTSIAKRFHIFLFLLSKSILHELTHIFVTFLGQGTTLTPPDVTVTTPGEQRSPRGEAGRYMEKLIYGGLIRVFENPDEVDEEMVDLPIGLQFIVYNSS